MQVLSILATLKLLQCWEHKYYPSFTKDPLTNVFAYLLISWRQEGNASSFYKD